MKDIKLKEKLNLVNESKLLRIQVIELKKTIDELKCKQYKIITKYKILTNEK